jgi:hypothetical protein
VEIKQARAAMSHPAFCGLSRRHLGELIAKLAPRWVARRESGRHERRAGGRRREAGAGPKYELVFTDRLLVALVHLRTGLTHEALGVLYEVGPSTIGRAIREVRPLLANRGFAVPDRPGILLRTLEDVFAYAGPEDVTLRIDGMETQVRRPRAGRPSRRAVTGALKMFDRTARELGQLLQLRAITWYGMRTLASGGGRSPLIAAATSPGTRHRHRRGRRFGGRLPPSPAAHRTPGHRTGYRTGPEPLRDQGPCGQLAATPTGPARPPPGGARRPRTERRARGLGDRTVQRTALLPSTSATHAFDRDELDRAAHRCALLALTDKFGLRLRVNGEVCRTLTLTVRYADRSRTTRSAPLPSPPATPPHSTAPPTTSTKRSPCSAPASGPWPCTPISHRPRPRTTN